MARRTTPRPMALLFAGPGESTLANTMALLNDFIGWSDSDDIPEDDDTRLSMILGETVTDGMKSIFEWTDEMEAAYDLILPTDPSKAALKFTNNADNVYNVTNPNAEGIENLRDLKETHDTYLVLLWGEEGDEDAETLLDLAAAYDIKPLDLTAGLDTISFEDEEPEVPEARHDDPPWDTEEDEKPQALVEQDEPLTEEEQPREDKMTTLVAALNQSAASRHDEADSFDVSSVPARSPGKFISAEDVAVAFDTVIDFLAAWSHLDEGHHGKVRAVEAQMWFQALNKRLFTALEAPARDVHVDSSEVLKTMSEGGSAADVLRVRKTSPAPEPTKTVEEAPEAAPAPKRGRSRLTTAREYFDEESGSWIRLGRGRPPKGVELRTVDVATGSVVEG